MQRSKQQALMFLLGAVLVGGVLGFVVTVAEGVFADLHASAADVNEGSKRRAVPPGAE